MPKKKWLREFTLNIAKGRNKQYPYRDLGDLLFPEPRRVTTFKRGVPIFSATVDTIRNVATGNRQYKPPPKLPTLRTDFDASSYHELRSKFQFHLLGIFPLGGSTFESEIYAVASELSLVGFIKVRAQYAIGHFQGDSYSMSYMRKWLKDRYNQEGTIQKIHFFDDSEGLPDFRYSKLECIKDWRSPVRRRQQMAVLYEEARLVKLSDKTRQRQQILKSGDS
jgi:hypothetical protein